MSHYFCNVQWTKVYAVSYTRLKCDCIFHVFSELEWFKWFVKINKYILNLE